MHDLVIRNATLIDGTGAPARVADVAVDGSRITAVGAVGAGRREVDGTGQLLTPGWVDMHTHYDGQVTWDPYFTPSGWHGVTTVVMGNCGVGFAPVRKAERDWLINVMEGVEDIPGSALHEGIRWEWETFPEYLDALERHPHVIDFATQLPHSAVRAYVMGPEAAEQRDATPAELLEMGRLVEEGLRAGALGFSTSRTPLHRTAKGVLVAGTHAPVEELLALGDAVRRAGHGVFEMAIEHVVLDQARAWLLDLARRTGGPVVFNLSQTFERPALWKDMLTLLEEAEAAGVPLFGQVAGRAIGILMHWQGTAHPFPGFPSYQAIAQLPWRERLERLKDPTVRARIVSDTPMDLGPFPNFVTRTFDNLYVLDRASDYEPDPRESIGARARREGVRPEALAYDALMAHNGNGTLYFPLFNFADGSLDLLHQLHQHPRTRMGLSDGGAHVGAICDSAMPTFMLSFWTRDRQRGPRLPLEHMVHRQTQQTAAFYGLHDRGIIAPGKKADLNLIDYGALDLTLPEMAFDLPAGGRRFLQRAHGYKMTVCSGVVIAENGEFTGAMPGKLVRGPQPA